MAEAQLEDLSRVQISHRGLLDRAARLPVFLQYPGFKIVIDRMVSDLQILLQLNAHNDQHRSFMLHRRFAEIERVVGAYVPETDQSAYEPHLKRLRAQLPDIEG